MIIDKYFPGLVEKIGYYEFIGDIISKDNIEIKISLSITGGIRAKNGIRAENGGIRAENGDIWAENGDIWAENGIRAENGDIWAENGIWAKNGDIWAENGIWAKNGDIRAKNGDIWAENGGIWAENGDIWAENGDIRAKNGDIWAVGEIKFKDKIIFFGIESKSIYIICDKLWTIWILDTHIKIGCEFHSKIKWKNFTDHEISKMNYQALEFWNKEKELILKL